MRPDLANYDAPAPLSYRSLVETAFASIGEPLGLEGFISQIGSRSLRDISHVPLFQPMIASGPPLPPEFTEHFFQFRDDNLGRGILDLAFRQSELVNFRAQVFLMRLFGRSKARSYVAREIGPVLQKLMGPPHRVKRGTAIFATRTVVGVARQVPGTDTISVSLTHEAYAGSGVPPDLVPRESTPATGGLSQKTAKNYMPQRVFNFGAAAVAKLHLLTGRSIEELAALGFARYRGAYTDDGIERDLTLAAQQALELLWEERALSPTELLNHFQYFIDNYEPDGHPRKKRLFGGTWFNKAEHNPRRKEDFLQLLKTYHDGVEADVLPLAPHGWSPANR